MVLFLQVAMLVFTLYSRGSFDSMKGFCSPSEVYGGWLVFSLRGIFLCFMYTPFSPPMGRIFVHLFLLMSTFRESWWVQLRCQSSPTHVTIYSFERHQLWWKLMLKTLLITFLELLFLEICVMPRGFWWALSLLPCCFMVFILFFTTSMGNMWRGSPLLNHLHA